MPQAAHLRPRFYDGLQILFTAEIAADEAARAHADGDGSVSVAELTIIEHLKAGTRGMIADGKGVNDGICGLNLVSEIPVEAVGVDALARKLCIPLLPQKTRIPAGAAAGILLGSNHIRSTMRDRSRR